MKATQLLHNLGQSLVELVKALAKRIIPELESETAPELKHDSSTNNVIRHYRKLKGAP